MSWILSHSPLDAFAWYFVVATVAACVGAVVFKKREPQAGAIVGALILTLGGILWGVFRAWGVSYVDTIAFSGEGVDPAWRYHELAPIFRETDAIGHTTVVVGACCLVVTCGCYFAFELRKSSIAMRAVCVVLLAGNAFALEPADRLSHRERTLHHETLVRSVETIKHPGFADDSCDSLEDTLSLDGDTPELESMLPDVRPRAHECIAQRLACIDAADGQCWDIMKGRTEVWNQLNPGKNKTELQLFVLDSSLLIDPQQKQEAMHRLLVAERSSP